MKLATKNTICYVRAFDGYPLARCTLKGHYYDPHFSRWMYVIKPLETAHGYVKDQVTTCYGVIPAICCRWLQSGLKFSPKPFKVDDNLPVYTYEGDILQPLNNLA